MVTVTTISTAQFSGQESDALRWEIQQVWLSASPGPHGGFHCDLLGTHLEVKGSFLELSRGRPDTLLSLSLNSEQRLTHGRSTGREADDGHSCL